VEEAARQLQGPRGAVVRNIAPATDMDPEPAGRPTRDIDGVTGRIPSSESPDPSRHPIYPVSLRALWRSIVADARLVG